MERCELTHRLSINLPYGTIVFTSTEAAANAQMEGRRRAPFIQSANRSGDVVVED